MQDNDSLPIQEFRDLIDSRLGVKIAGSENGLLALSHRIRPGAEPELKDLLAAGTLDDSVAACRHVHSLECLVLNGHLLVCGHFDAPLQHGFAELLAHARSGLDALWSHCEGYPAAAAPDAFLDFIRSGVADCDYVFTAYPEASVQDIRRALDWMKKTQHFQIELAKLPRQR